MTTNINAAPATTETTETTVAPVTTTATDRNTLKSTLEKGQVKLLAGILFNMAGSAASFKKLNETWKDAAKLVPDLFKTAEKDAAETSKAREEAKAKLKETREADKAAQLKALEQQQADMLKMMVEVMGLDKDAALVACEAAMKQKRKAIETASVREQVTVSVNGVQYTMPRKGNMSQALKDLVTDSGLERDAFIDKYEVKAVVEAPVNEETNTEEEA